MLVNPMLLLIRGAVTSVHILRKLVWFFSRPKTFGVDAIALTAEGKIVLVKLTYAKGWHLPGGARKRSEDPEKAIRRELKEEIGMTNCGSIELLGEFQQRKDFKHDTMSVFLAQDVHYRPAPCLEIAEVREFDLEQLPAEAKHVREWAGRACRRIRFSSRNSKWHPAEEPDISGDTGTLA